MSRNPKIKNTKKNRTKYGIPVTETHKYDIKTSPDFFTPNPDDGIIPIDRLENDGYKILKNEKGQIEVRVGKSDNLLECYQSYRDEKLDELKVCYIDKDEIVDYNSLWELTKSGWDSDDVKNPDYPYI